VPEQATSSVNTALARWHGVAVGDVHFGAATWFGDVLERFGYDLFEHDHQWDGEWIDDAFEAAAIDLRSTVAKLLRVIDELDPERIDAERTPLLVDLAFAYVHRLLGDVAIAVPCCFGTEGRQLAGARGDIGAMADAVSGLDPAAALALRPPAIIDRSIPTHRADLYAVVDASGLTPALPKSTARLRAESASMTVSAIGALDLVLAALCEWLDGVLTALQRAVAVRAEDGEELLERWAATDWSRLGPASDLVAAHLPALDRR
jgi:hypothetical protein